MKYPAYSQLRPVTPNVGVVLAPNPSYAALEGTNSWIIRGPEDKVSVVVDPGPQDEGHLNVLNTKATQDGAEIALVILTHRHADHASGTHRFRQIAGAPVRAFDKQYCIAAEELTDGEIISVPGLTPTIEVVHTPGHTSDSVSLFVHGSSFEGDAAADASLEGILTGDTIAGRHTTMISETDGDLGDYLETLAKLKDRGAGIPLLPGHGPDQPDTAEVAARYIQRREQRLEQVKEAMRELGDDAAVMDIVDRIYTDVDPVLRDAAAQSTRVTMRFLRGD